MWSLLLIVVVVLVALLYTPLINTHTQLKVEADERNMLLNDDEFKHTIQNRHYTPLHVLPTVRWHSNFNTLNNTTSCFSVPTLVTATNTGTFDCGAVCNDNRAVYFFVNPNDNYIVNGVRLMSGGYCTMNSVPRNCNHETSLIFYSVNQWTCIAEDPRYFAGEGNLVQIAGRQHSESILSEEMDKIVLWDNQLNRQVNPVMNTFRYSWDERMSDNRRRFEIKCDALDIRHNLMFNNPLNPIECLPNVCTPVQWVHRNVKPIYETGVCDCGDFNVTRVQHINDNDPSSLCAAIVNRLNVTNKQYSFRVECLSLDTPITLFSKDKLLCPPEIFNQNTDFAFTFTLNGVVPLSGNGINEPTTQLWNDTRSRVDWNDTR
ncbi:per os infectivity factor 2 [Erinnyis ello granulovirus]|uniref:Per os infectivity factor 2 n=1 Tax=Erinnyis ello granulovirus TaxID=307444 RepID=A0A097DAM3_9BBAC|nr:per os infectivity factor 2 [Erinnyis ello granulovirus]AIS92042.1 per os infectivity factor 2 [Erinnyis ello granulovirus]ARX71381.1 per os infectivity factor 2 [Erinnyis ello granulovirus]ARX71511.1 per os infectivity factor 2 [Erinnyis ello granulovirus]ARX71641.1 per os infectivity factor 2 [Erinnyis ello granulovirus]ARX71771.1 per os infectivity factor 2 [Erinnyis ello granulovirus]